jgi:ParB family chromosome partitioning protein
MPTQDTPSKKNALGRGLQAILKDSSYFTEKGEVNPLREIPVDQIVVNPLQPRKHFDPTALEELAESIKVHGVIQPLTIRQVGPQQYQLIAGERRLQAAIKAGLKLVPTYIRVADDQQVLEMALVENIQRESLNPIEIALSYERLRTECSVSLEELGSRVGKNRATVNNYLRLLKLPPDIQVALKEQKISMGHARALINVKAATVQLGILKEIISQDLSVRKVEELAKDAIPKPLQIVSKKTSTNPTLAVALQELITQLTHRLGTSVKARTYAQGHGEICIGFKDAQALHKMIRILCAT